MECIELMQMKNIFNNIKVIIKLHPSDTKFKYSKIIKKFKSIDTIILPEDIDIFSLSKHCYAIIGIFSMLLIELSIINANVFSYQPALKKNILYITQNVNLISNKKILLNSLISINKKSKLKSLNFSAIKKINKLIMSCKKSIKCK